MKRKFWVRASVTLMTIGLFSVCANATPITGLINTNGSATVNLTDILFASSSGTAGVFMDDIPATVSFAGLAGDAGAITNLNTVLEPTGTTFDDPNWMVFSGPPNANISFDLTFIDAGNDPLGPCTALIPLAGQTCSLPGSPFDLTNEGPVDGGSVITAVGVSFAVSGIAVNTLTNETSDFTGGLGLSGQLLDSTSGATLTTLQQVVASIEAGHNVTGGYTGSFSAFPSGVPEPSTIVLGSLGALLFIAGSLRRKKRT